MARIVGLGGVFYRVSDPKARKDWYVKHLGIRPGDGYEGVEMRWRRPDDPEHQEMSLISFFDQDTEYLGEAGHPFMINFVVDDVEGMIKKLKDEGCDTDGKVVDEGYGKFAWVTDPDGVRIEMWQPAMSVPDFPKD